MTMSIQSRDELERVYTSPDPWGYSGNKDDVIRRSRLLSVLPKRHYERVLDIGCGDGFVTRQLPGDSIVGIDLSANAIAFANSPADSRIKYQQMSFFDLPHAGWAHSFDLIVITGVLYPQYIGEGNRLATVIVDELLKDGGHLVTAHIFEWYRLRFPYTALVREYYGYREYTHVLEVYEK
jgi:2-polyprenyl-3-methyl-5-hydroxy-6-metoxy-1,4-benzoquinol methylase